MRLSSRTLLILASLALASCSPIVSVRGHNEQISDFSQIIAGQSTTEDVQAILGSPSSQSSFGETTWYYITTTEEVVGAFASTITQQQVTAITFDEQLAVKGIETYDIKDGKPIRIVSKQTPSEGHKMTFIEQMLGNLGRFNSPAGRTAQPGGRR